MELMPHQQRILDKNPKKALLNWEMRCGKTLPAAIWITRKPGARLVVCPKQLKADWMKSVGPEVLVMSKEEFKKNAGDLPMLSAIVVDEAHYFASPLFVGKRRSQLATALYTLIKHNQDMDVLLLTATPVRNDAWSLHTLLCYIGVYYPWKEWREEFFELKKMPFLRFPAWFPKHDWRERLRPYLEKHTDIVSLRDIVEYLPPAIDTVIRVKHAKHYKKPEDEVVTWTHEHLWEQNDKIPEILALGYRKVLIVAHYTAQIDALAKELSAEKRVYVLDGRTRDADSVKRAAQEDEECYLIVQSSMGFGFDGYMFGATVFVSMSHSVVNHTQMLGRARHIKHLQPVVYYYLIGGRWDKRIYDTVMAGQDFNPHNYHD